MSVLQKSMSCTLYLICVCYLKAHLYNQQTAGYVLLQSDYDWHLNDQYTVINVVFR